MATDTDQTLKPETVAAVAAWHAGDVDGDEITFAAARRNLSAKGSGEQTYRRIVLPGQSRSQWPECDRLPRLGGTYAADRRCTSYATAPIGSIILSYDSDVWRYRASRARLTVYLLRNHEQMLVPVESKKLRSRPVLQVTLPDGAIVEIGIER